MKKHYYVDHIYSKFQNTPEKGNLYLGAVGFLNHPEQIKERQINCVLTILDDWAYPRFKVKEKLQHLQMPISHRIKLEDSEEASIFPQLKNATHFIKQNLEKTNVFVHCQAGVSRSSSLVIAYLMQEKGISRDQARKHVQERRQCICPNQTFWKDLYLWQCELHKQLSK